MLVLLAVVVQPVWLDLRSPSIVVLQRYWPSDLHLLVEGRSIKPHSYASHGPIFRVEGFRLRYSGKASFLDRVGLSANRGPPYKPQNTMIPFMGIFKKREP